MASNRNSRNITIENARIAFKNFEGKADRYNAAGDRNFLLLLDDPDLTDRLISDGWNVKYLKPRDEEEEEEAVPQPYIKVSVAYGNFPPNVFTVTSRGKTLLDEDTVQLLDYAEVENWDVIISPYDWVVNEKTGTKAYLKALYAKLVEDPLMLKYMETPNA